MAKIKTLKDYNDEIIYPQSTTRAIVNAEGVNLDTLHSKFVMTEQVTEIEEVDDYYEIRNNKITTINSTSNDENYPSAKAVYDFGMTIKNESIEIAKTEVNELKGMVDEIAQKSIKYITVSDLGLSYYSIDGETWIPMSGLDNDIIFYAVAYGNGRFVTVGQSGLSYYSTDGLNWIPMSEAGAKPLFSVVYGNDRFIAGGNMGVMFHSLDGQTWVSVTSPSSENIRAITYGNGRFVIVNEDGFSYYSTDGLNWTAMSGLDIEEGSIRYYGVTYGNDRFICVGSSGNAYYSIDGETWVSVINQFSDYMSAITYGNGRFVTVGDLGLSYYSIDGETWIPMTGLNEDCNYNGVTYGNGRFVAVGDLGSSYYSIDGETWIPMTGLNGENDISYRAVAYSESVSTIPTKTSELINDSGYLIQSDISNLATTTYVDNAISNAITTAIGGAY